MRCFELTGPDERMDCRSLADEPLNPLPQLCGKCGFPELDHVPQPYLLIRSRTMSPHELALAENRNFFVRPRIRRVLEVLAPRQCLFFPTSHEQTASPTPWFLVCRKNLVATATGKHSIARCET